MRNLLLVLVALGMFATEGVAAVIDFESLASYPSPFLLLAEPYTEDGFSLTTSQGSGLRVHNSKDLATYDGSTALGAYFAHTTNDINLTMIDGSTFTVYSMDFTGGFGGRSAVPTFTVTGSILGGGTITQQIILDQLKGFETFTFSGFTNLTQLSWEYAAYNQVDNIVLDQVASICSSRTTGLDRAGCSGGVNGEQGRDIASSRVVNPEPTTWLLFATGIGALALLKRRQTKRDL